MRVSKQESEVFGINFARTEINFGEPFNRFINELCKQKIDICRVKIPVQRLDFIESIERSGFWSSIYNINLKNRLNVPKNFSEGLLKDYETIDIEDDAIEELTDIVNYSIKTKGWVSNHSFYSKPFISNKNEVIAGRKWVLSFRDSEGKILRGLKYKGQLIGYFTGSIINGNEFHGGLFGIAEGWRNQGHSKAIYLSTIQLCTQLKLKYFTCEVGLSNVKSQKSAIFSGLNTEGSFLHIEIYPFFNLLFEKQKTSDFIANNKSLSTSRVIISNEYLCSKYDVLDHKVLISKADNLIKYAKILKHKNTTEITYCIDDINSKIH